MGYLRYVILCLAVVLTVACRRSGAVEDPLLVKAPSVEDVDELCRPLVDGDYGKYVSGMLSASDKSETYRRQLTDMMKQRAVIDTEERGGLRDIVVTSVRQSEPHRLYAEAKVSFLYNDGSAETVRVPLVYNDGDWWLR